MPLLSTFRRSFAVLGLALLCGYVERVSAQTASEDEVKAAFLFNFAKFVEWPDAPENDGGRIVVAVYGDDDFAATVGRAIAGKTAGGRPIVVDRIAPPTELPPCQILFIADSQKDRLGALLAAAGRTPVLTVGETDDFVDRGGVIGFSMHENKLRFSVNAGAAEKVGLKISSQLTKLALRVLP